jgi:hypothetical protein
MAYTILICIQLNPFSLRLNGIYQRAKCKHMVYLYTLAYII